MTAETREIESLLPESVAEVLETMFFSEAEAAPEEPLAAPDQSGNWIAIEVQFSGSPSGRFWLWINRGTAVRLAADFLGLEDSETNEEHAVQTACELSNMICGRIVSKIESDTAFALSAPQPVAIDAGAKPQRRFVIDGGSLWVAFEIQTG